MHPLISLFQRFSNAMLQSILVRCQNHLQLSHKKTKIYHDIWNENFQNNILVRNYFVLLFVEFALENKTGVDYQKLLKLQIVCMYLIIHLYFQKNLQYIRKHFSQHDIYRYNAWSCGNRFKLSGRYRCTTLTLDTWNKWVGIFKFTPCNKSWPRPFRSC